MTSRRQRPAMDCCPFSFQTKTFSRNFPYPVNFCLLESPIIEGQALNKILEVFVYGEISSCH